MLISLDESLVEGVGAFDAVEWDALNNLAVAAREGRHFLLAPRSLAASLAEHPMIGARERAFYRMLSERFSTLAAVTAAVSISIRVDRDSAPNRIVIGDRVQIRLPLGFFRTTRSVQSVILVAENRDDCVIIYEMTRAFARTKRVAAVQTSLEFLPGGGSQTYEVADDVLRAGERLVVVVVDSDRETPAGALGDTARNARRIFRERDRAFAELLILRARDLENLLPDDFYTLELGADQHHRDSIAFITNLNGAGCETARLHIDIERGLRLRALLHPERAPDDFADVWGPVVSALRDSKLPSTIGHRQCAKDELCGENGDCNCILTRENGADILPMAEVSFQRRGRELWESMPKFMESAASEMTRLIFDWGCASTPQAS